MQNKWRKAGIEIVRRKGEKKSEDLQYQLVNKTSMSLAARVEPPLMSRASALDTQCGGSSRLLCACRSRSTVGSTSARSTKHQTLNNFCI